MPDPEPQATPAAVAPSNKPAGWSFPANSRKAHYFPDGELISACGKWMHNATREPEDGRRSADDCAACVKRLPKASTTPAGEAARGEITHITTTTFGVRCDKRRCAAEFLLPEPVHGTAYDGEKEIARLAPLAGWTAWRHRWREWRCPDHPMTPVQRYRYSTYQVLPKPEAVTRG